MLVTVIRRRTPTFRLLGCASVRHSAHEDDWKVFSLRRRAERSGSGDQDEDDGETEEGATTAGAHAMKVLSDFRFRSE